MTLFKKINIVLISSLFFCTSPINDGSEVTNGLVTGRVVTTDGAAVQGATVLLIRDTLNPMTINSTSAIDSTHTNDRGYYGFSTISNGWYNLLASSAGRKGYQDSIYINQMGKLQLKDIVLETPVSCSGSVRLENRQLGEGDVIILILGTNTYTTSNDSSGAFILPALAAGTYKIRVLTTVPEYEVKDTMIDIQTGAANTMKNPIQLKFLGIAKVGPLKVMYNGGMKLVTISWPKLDTSKVLAYNIYRRAPTVSEPFLYKTQADTFFIDDVFEKIGDTLIYVVSAVDHSLKEGGFSDAFSLTITDSFTCVRSISFNMAMWGMTRDSSGNIYIGEFNSVMKYNPDGNLLKSYIDTVDTVKGHDLYHKMFLSADGTLYVWDIVTMHMVHLSSDLSFMAQYSFNPRDSDYSAYSDYYEPMTLDNEGNIFFCSYNSGIDKSNITKYSPAFTPLKSWTMDGGFRLLQWSNDTAIAIDYNLTGGSIDSWFFSISYYNSTLEQIGAWDIKKDALPFSPDTTALLYTQYYRGKNGWSALFSRQDFGLPFQFAFNTPGVPRIAMFFDGNQKILARTYLYGHIVDIDETGAIHWISGSTFSTYRIR